MNFLKRLFKGKESIYKAADDAIIKLTALGLGYVFHERENETSINKGQAKDDFQEKFFEFINMFKGERVNHRHLTMIVDLSTSDIHPNKSVKSLLEKNDFIIDVFGEVADVSSFTISGKEPVEYVTIFDTDKTKKVPRVTTINIHLKSDKHREVIRNLKKGEKKAFKIRIPEDTKVNGFGRHMLSHIDSLLDFHMTGNEILRIISNSKIRYDIKGELLDFNGNDGIDLIHK